MTFVLATFIIGVIFIVWSLTVLREVSLHSRIAMSVGIGLILATIVALFEYMRYGRLMR